KKSLPRLIPLPDARAACPRRGPSESALPEGGGRSGRIEPGQGGSARTGGVYWHPCKVSASAAWPHWGGGSQVLLPQGDSGLLRTGNPLVYMGCGSRFTSLTFPRMPVRFSGLLPVWGRKL